MNRASGCPWDLEPHFHLTPLQIQPFPRRNLSHLDIEWSAPSRPLRILALEISEAAHLPLRGSLAIGGTFEGKWCYISVFRPSLDPIPPKQANIVIAGSTKVWRGWKSIVTQADTTEVSILRSCCYPQNPMPVESLGLDRRHLGCFSQQVLNKKKIDSLVKCIRGQQWTGFCGFPERSAAVVDGAVGRSDNRRTQCLWFLQEISVRTDFVRSGKE